MKTKPHWTKQMQLASQLFDRKTIDEAAETCEEISASTNRGISSVHREVRNMIASGKVERVWKRKGTQLVPAYRVKTTA